MNSKDKSLLEGLVAKYGVEQVENKVNEAFFDKNKRHLYNDKKQYNQYETQPVIDGVRLQDIRQRVYEIMRNCTAEDHAIANKQAWRLYKLVDALINQGYYID